jgi:hypothetical protein
MAHDDGYYTQCQKLWKLYMNTHPHITSYFIKYKPDLDTIVARYEDTIYVKGRESYSPGCLDKTIQSIQFILNQENDFDYIFRTNLSSVVDLNKLYIYLENNSHKYAGVNVTYFNCIYASGAGILMSKEICNVLIENRELLDYNIIDDISIGRLFEKLHIPLETLKKIDIYEDMLEQITNYNIQDYYHFRCKARGDYKYTPVIMKKIISNVYDKSIIRENYVNQAKQTLALLIQNKYPNKVSIDICEHLTTLYTYAKECNSIFETGVRGCVSSWAFLNGLNDSRETNKKQMLLNDIEKCDIDDLINVAEMIDIDVQYIWKNNLDIVVSGTYDMVFIDTWHVYGQLKRELEKFSVLANKYIIMHDTTVDGIYGETIRNGWNASYQSECTGIPVEEITKGLWPAIEEFIENNNDWYIKERFTNNNGLTILARKTLHV